jgi:hypothetical protein
MCSPTTIGPILSAHHALTAGRRNRLLSERRLRMHGWARSVAYLMTMARDAGIRGRFVGRHGHYACLMFGGAVESGFSRTRKTGSVR